MNVFTGRRQPRLYLPAAPGGSNPCFPPQLPKNTIKAVSRGAELRARGSARCQRAALGDAGCTLYVQCYHARSTLAAVKTSAPLPCAPVGAGTATACGERIALQAAQRLSGERRSLTRLAAPPESVLSLRASKSPVSLCTEG